MEEWRDAREGVRCRKASQSLDAVWFRERPPGRPWSRYRNARAPLADVLFPTIGVHNNALETDMPILAKVGGLAILAGAGAAVFFFGGYYSVAGTAEDPGVDPGAHGVDRSPRT